MHDSTLSARCKHYPHGSTLRAQRAQYPLTSSQFNCALQVNNVGDVMNLATLHGRIELVFTLTQVYRLLHLMARRVPVLETRHAIYGSMKRSYGTVEFMPDYVRKVIPGFAQFANAHSTDLNTLTAAYKAATQAYNGSQHGPFLITAKKMPAVRSSTYTVCTTPVGYEPVMRSEVRSSRSAFDCQCLLKIV